MQSTAQVKPESCKSAIYEAMENDEFKFLLQPKVAILDDRIIGAELLLRCEFDRWGPETVFEKLGEHPDLIEFTIYLFDKAKAIHATLKERAGIDWPLSINLNGHQLKKEEIITFLTNSNFQKSFLIEVTESLQSINERSSKNNLDRLKKSGFKIALDDFGAGYSNYSILGEVPFDYLKIDKSVVNSGGCNNSAILEQLVALGLRLNADIIFEGVESSTKIDELRSLGGKYAQGYFYSKPVCLDEFLDLMEAKDV